MLNHVKFSMIHFIWNVHLSSNEFGPLIESILATHAHILDRTLQARH
jgi:hypothetical protein